MTDIEESSKRELEAAIAQAMEDFRKRVEEAFMPFKGLRTRRNKEGISGSLEEPTISVVSTENTATQGVAAAKKSLVENCSITLEVEKKSEEDVEDDPTHLIGREESRSVTAGKLDGSKILDGELDCGVVGVPRNFKSGGRLGDYGAGFTGGGRGGFAGESGGRAGGLTGGLIGVGGLGGGVSILEGGSGGDFGGGTREIGGALDIVRGNRAGIFRGGCLGGIFEKGGAGFCGSGGGPGVLAGKVERGGKTAASGGLNGKGGGFAKGGSGASGSGGGPGVCIGSPLCAGEKSCGGLGCCGGGEERWKWQLQISEMGCLGSFVETEFGLEDKEFLEGEGVSISKGIMVKGVRHDLDGNPIMPNVVAAQSFGLTHSKVSGLTHFRPNLSHPKQPITISKDRFYCPPPHNHDMSTSQIKVFKHNCSFFSYLHPSNLNADTTHTTQKLIIPNDKLLSYSAISMLMKRALILANVQPFSLQFALSFSPFKSWNSDHCCQGRISSADYYPP